MLYDVAILEKPTKKEAEAGKKEKLKYGPQAIVADTEEGARIQAIKACPDIDTDRAQVLIRPFS